MASYRDLFYSKSKKIKEAILHDLKVFASKGGLLSYEYVSFFLNCEWIKKHRLCPNYIQDKKHSFASGNAHIGKWLSNANYESETKRSQKLFQKGHRRLVRWKATFIQTLILSHFAIATLKARLDFNNK